MMIVNAAGKCGFALQYERLQRLYEKYEDNGFVILGFPANNFMGQELSSTAEIKNFCSLTYGVTFPMFEKISVKGKGRHSLYKYMTDKKSNPEFSGDIS